MKVRTISFLSCIGPRENQEDAIYPVSKNNAERIFVLCDGMGGHGHGEIASRTVAESVYGYLSELKLREYNPTDIQNALNYALVELAKVNTFADEKAMGTTIVVAVINSDNILVGHIGDSRCYVFNRNGQKKFRTKDHSMVQEAVDAEILTEEEAWNNPKKNVLTRCILATHTAVTIDVDVLNVDDGDILLLCSDGVTDAIRDGQLQSIMINRDVDDIANVINAECNISSKDNFSAIIIEISNDCIQIDDKKECIDNVHGNDFWYCPRCHAKISTNISYCPECCSKELVIIPPYKSFFERNKNIIYLVISAFLIGLAASYLLTYCKHNHSNYNFGNSDTMINKNDVTQFITNICDTTPNGADSLINKSMLIQQYNKFLNSINEVGDSFVDINDSNI